MRRTPGSPPNFIRVFAALFAIGMVGLIWREWRAADPIMNLKLFKFRNFAVCALLMILVGGILNATTVLQPQFSQELLNYTATLAGEALTGGGIVLLFVMPLSGFAAGRFAARNILAIGFALFAGSVLLHVHAPQSRHELRLRHLVANRADRAYPVVLHRDHECRLYWSA